MVELRGNIYSFADDPACKERDLAVNLETVPGYWRTYGLAFHPRFRENRHVYICYVLKTNHPKGYPAEWGNFETIPGVAPADYEMDPEVCENPSYRPQVM